MRERPNKPQHVPSNTRAVEQELVANETQTCEHPRTLGGEIWSWQASFWSVTPAETASIVAGTTQQLAQPFPSTQGASHRPAQASQHNKRAGLVILRRRGRS